METIKDRCSQPDVFCKKGVLENLAKFTGKHPCQSLFFNKVAGLTPETLLKKRTWHRCFPVDFAKFSETPFFIEHLWWLLLKGQEDIINNNILFQFLFISFLELEL